ncbi:MAG: universal stress protein [Acidimicrobiales bacterium]
MSENRQHRIVVGIEGSGGARAGLQWAICEARYRSALIEVVTAYSPTYVPAAPDVGFMPVNMTDIVSEVQALQDAVVSSVQERIDAAGVEVTQTIIRGRAADALVKVAEGADMLVVGNRGRGGFRGLRLGSVSHQIAQHASCPVMIVRTDIEPEDWDDIELADPSTAIS